MPLSRKFAAFGNLDGDVERRPVRLYNRPVSDRIEYVLKNLQRAETNELDKGLVIIANVN